MTFPLTKLHKKQEEAAKRRFFSLLSKPQESILLAWSTQYGVYRVGWIFGLDRTAVYAVAEGKVVYVVPFDENSTSDDVQNFVDLIMVHMIHVT